MKKIRVLKAEFSEPISQVEIPMFRGAVLKEISEDANAPVLFHNHDENGKLRWKYPLIQYKVGRHGAQLVCFEEGVDQVNRLFQANTFNMRLGNRKVKMEVSDLRLHYHVLQVWDRMIPYRIYNWLALNEANYIKYRILVDKDEKRQFLEKILCGNILSMAKGLDWYVEKQIEVVLDEVIRTRPTKYKDAELMGFYVRFRTNVSLPPDAGIGKGSSIGFGTVRLTKNKQPAT